jgi:hypothetical protein
MMMIRAGWLPHVLFSMLLVCGFHAAVAAADSRDAKPLTARELIELAFPSGSQWRSAPVVKWASAPSVLVLSEAAVTGSERAAVRAELAPLAAAGLIQVPRFQDISAADRSAAAQAEGADILLVYGPKALEMARGPYRALLASVLPAGAGVDGAVDEAVAKGLPALGKSRFDPQTGRLKRYAAFEVTDGDADGVRQTTIIAILSSLAPSVQSSPLGAALLIGPNSDINLTPQAMQYLRFLYSDKVPQGIGFADLVQEIVP